MSDIIDFYRELQVQICVFCDLICGMQCAQRRGNVKKKMAVGSSVQDDSTCKLYYHDDPV